MSLTRAYRLLAALPALAILVGVPFVNGARGYVLGLPILLFWIVSCVVLTSVMMAVVGALDHRHDARADRGREAREDAPANRDRP